MPADFDPPQFAWLGDQAFWRPFGATESNRSWGRFLLVIARVRPTVSIDAARRELEAVSAQLATEVKDKRGVVGHAARALRADHRRCTIAAAGAARRCVAFCCSWRSRTSRT
jgi:hypothetical protein